MQDEISLREVIETLLRGKWIIVMFTITAMLFSGFTSVFILKPTYEALSTVRIGNGAANQNDALNFTALAESLRTDVALKRVIDKLELANYSINSVRNSIKVEIVKDTSVMKIRVSGKDPSIITNISNIMAFELGARVEISDRAQRIVAAKKRVNDLEDLIAISSNSLEESNKQLEQNPEKLITKQSLADVPYLQSIIKDSTSASNRDIGAIELESETINPVYSILKENIATTNIELSRLKTEKQNLETEITKNEEKIVNLEQQIVREKLRAMSSERLLNGYIAVFISPAIEPTAPIGPKTSLNIMIGGVVGFMLSLLIIFFRQYWNNSKINSYPEENKTVTV